MYIYKITNTTNGKIYIGQTNKTPEKRFQRHINDALTNRVDTHLSRAIRKDGPEVFIIEEIDTAKTQEELNKKEQYYIHFFNTLENGYNETDSINKCGGNTYAGRSEEKMSITKEKLSQAKMGGKNPASRKVKCKNINTNEELHFDSYSEMQDYFGENNHNFITRRCRDITKCLYKKEWAIAYEENEYNNFTKEKNNSRSKKIKVIDLNTQEETIYPSRAAAERACNFPKNQISSKLRYKPQGYIENNYQIIPLN